MLGDSIGSSPIFLVNRMPQCRDFNFLNYWIFEFFLFEFLNFLKSAPYVIESGGLTDFDPLFRSISGSVIMILCT